MTHERRIFKLKELPDSAQKKNTVNIFLSLKYSPNVGNNIKFVGEVNKFFRLKLPKHSVSGKQSIHLIFNMGVVK